MNVWLYVTTRHGSLLAAGNCSCLPAIWLKVVALLKLFFSLLKMTEHFVHEITIVDQFQSSGSGWVSVTFQ